jgi:hypothetical protein
MPRRASAWIKRCYYPVNQLGAVDLLGKLAGAQLFIVHILEALDAAWRRQACRAAPSR